MKKLFFLIGFLLFFLACGSTEQPVQSENNKQRSLVDSIDGINRIEEKLEDSILESEVKINKRKNNDTPQFFTRINDFDSLGRPFVRWIEFKNTITGEVLQKIDIIEDDNPFIKSGLKIDYIDENGPIVYYDLGENANKVKLKKFLPSEKYISIPEDLFYPKAMSFVQVIKINNYLVVDYSFEWVGLEREWIRGEYISHAVSAYNNSGELVYNEINTPGNLSFISSNKEYLFFTKNKNFDDWDKQKGCIKILSTSKNEIIYTNCRLHTEWFKKNKLFGEYVIFVNCKRKENICDQIFLFHPKKETFYFIQLNDDETIDYQDEKYIKINNLTSKKSQIIVPDYEILNKK